jgi:hypothetical protein
MGCKMTVSLMGRKVTVTHLMGCKMTVLWVIR